MLVLIPAHDEQASIGTMDRQVGALNQGWRRN